MAAAVERDVDRVSKRSHLVAAATVLTRRISSVIGDLEQNVDVTRLVERAVAREVGAAQLLLDVLDCDRQPTRKQIVAVPTNGLGASELQRMGIAPLGRSRHDDDARRKARSLST
jgi:hypothetical protein